MKIAKLLASAVLAGVMIGLGCVVNLSVDNRIIGALLFGIGLFVICTRGYSLFTGKVLYVVENNGPAPVNLGVIWLGNLTGTAIVAMMMHETRVASGIRERAEEITATKLNDGVGCLVVLGILCELCIFIAVDGYKKLSTSSGSNSYAYIPVFLGVMVFILSGFEHSIADMGYAFLARLEPIEFCRIVVPVTVGNILGGVWELSLERWLRSDGR